MHLSQLILLARLPPLAELNRKILAYGRLVTKFPCIAALKAEETALAQPGPDRQRQTSTGRLVVRERICAPCTTLPNVRCIAAL